jgi:hypothetical protein
VVLPRQHYIPLPSPKRQNPQVSKGFKIANTFCGQLSFPFFLFSHQKAGEKQNEKITNPGIANTLGIPNRVGS